MNAQRHAYLIMAHKVSNQFFKLIELLDNEHNDLFIHMDKKAGRFSKDKIKSATRKSRVYFLNRRSLHWGNADLVKCELDLISLCLKTDRYSWVHLISGSDLPIKPQSYIYDYFTNHPNTQFIQMRDSTPYVNRLSKYHFFIGRKQSFVIRNLTALLNTFNRCFKVNRIKKKNITPVKTSQWFSVTKECAEFINEKRKYILRFTRFTECPDEMFLGTVLKGSKFWNEIYNTDSSFAGHLRYIDWGSGGKSPRVLNMNYKDIIDCSNTLFARKFDETVDADIIEYVYKKVLE